MEQVETISTLIVLSHCAFRLILRDKGKKKQRHVTSANREMSHFPLGGTS